MASFPSTANQSGNYQILGLQSGAYEIVAAQPKFTSVQRNEVALRVGDEVRIDLSLPPGESRESIVVTETTPLVQLETATAFAVVNASPTRPIRGSASLRSGAMCIRTPASPPVPSRPIPPTPIRSRIHVLS